MHCVGHQLTMRGSVASKLIGHELPWRLTLLLEKLAKEAGRGFLVSSLLDQDIRRLTILIHRSIQIALLTVDPEKHFIDKPLIATGPGALSDPIGVDRAKAYAPAPDHLIRCVDPALSQ